MQLKPSVIDLFAGAGGISLGALRAGFKVFGAIELDDKALDTHSRNFPTITHFKTDLGVISPKELRELTALEKGTIDGIIGGPPCQGFSHMGHRNENDVRNNLFERFFDFVMEFQPSFFMAENVLGILDEKYDSVRQRALDKVAGKYTVLPHLKMNASDYGTPTNRTRVFFIGYDKKKMSTFSVDDFIKTIVPKHKRITVKDALTGLPEDVSGLLDGFGKVSNRWQTMMATQRNKSYYWRRISGKIPQNIGDKCYIERYEKKHIVSGCLPTRHGKDVEKRYLELEYGQQDKTSKSIKLNPAGFCPTLRAGTGPEKGSYQAVRPIHYSVPRVITPREAARLQGFPDWFDFHPTIWHSFRQIGNSVSPILAEKVLKVIRHKLT